MARLSIVERWPTRDASKAVREQYDVACLFFAITISTPTLPPLCLRFWQLLDPLLDHSFLQAQRGSPGSPARKRSGFARKHTGKIQAVLRHGARERGI